MRNESGRNAPPDGERHKRQRARQYGLAGERLAALSLQLKGYRILERNYRTKLGEIDIIARKGDLVAIVEVKARSDVTSAADAVGYQARQRIERAARHWLATRRDANRLSLRFDIIAVRPWRWPVHLENAF
ncbi:MAG: YraN family protein [Nitratireductor sp.]|nr:YraN family protein [Nitratireductor sp.]